MVYEYCRSGDNQPNSIGHSLYFSSIRATQAQKGIRKNKKEQEEGLNGHIFVVFGYADTLLFHCILLCERNSKDKREQSTDRINRRLGIVFNVLKSFLRH